MSICCKTDIRNTKNATEISTLISAAFSYCITEKRRQRKLSRTPLSASMNALYLLFPESQTARLFVKWLTIGSDHIFIPIEGFFLITVQCTCSIVVAVHVDVAVAFFQLCCRCTDKVNAAPGGVAHKLYVFFFHEQVPISAYCFSQLRRKLTWFG